MFLQNYGRRRGLWHYGIAYSLDPIIKIISVC